MAWAFPMCYEFPMRAHVGQIDHSGVRRFLLGDWIPADSIGQLVRELTSPTTRVVRAVVDEEDAEVIRRELRAGDHGEAFSLLLDRLVEILALDEHAPLFLRPPDNPPPARQPGPSGSSSCGSRRAFARRANS